MRHKKLLIFLSVIISLALITARLFLACFFRFDKICMAARTESGSIIANDDETNIKLFLMSGDRIDRADSCISYKKYFEDSNEVLGYNYPLDIAENDGKIYLLNVKNYLSESSLEYEIRLLDFKRKKSETIFSVSDVEISSMMRDFLINENAAEDAPDSYYYICGNTFDVEDGGITLYLAEWPRKYKGMSAVYKCKLTGGEIRGAEKISWYRTDQFDGIIILGNNVLQLDNGYRLLIGGENTEYFEKDRYSMFCRPDRLDGCSAVARSIENGGFYKIDPENKTVTEYPENCKLTETDTLRFGDIMDFYTLGKDGTAAVCFDGEKSFLYDVNSSKKADWIFTESAAEAVIYSVITGVAAAAAVWLAGFLIGTLRARGRVSVKFVVLIIPVMLGCDLAAYAVIGLGMNVIEDYIFQSSLKALSAQYGSLGLTDGIGDFGSGYEDEITGFTSILVDSEYLRSVYWTEDSGTSADVNYLGYIRGGNILAAAADIIDGNYDVDALSQLPSKTAEKIREAAESRSDKYCRIYYGGSEREFLISPTFFSGDGKVNGVFLYSVNSAEIRHSSKKLLIRLLNYKVILSAVISLLFTLSAVFPLRGLKKLQKKSADYLSGGFAPRLSEEKKRGGCINEIDVISEKFDELLNSVCNEFSEIDNLRKANTAYFSDAILKIFNKKTINSVKFGESVSVNAYCIKALLPEEKYSGFDNMNRLLTALGKSLKEYNAFAADIGSTSISVYSTEPESLHILFFFREYDPGIIAAADRCYIDISIVNIGGSCRFNIVREDIKRSEILMNTLINTCSATAVTESALEQRKGDLSAICIGMVDNGFIYEISDGANERFANSIRGHLKIGIEKYFNGDHAAAREMFVMILKSQQNNSVARYYINLLDGEFNEYEENMQ